MNDAGGAFVIFDGALDIVILTENLQVRHTFVNVLHELLQFLKVKLELMNYFSPCFFEVHVEELLLDLGDFVLQYLL